MPVPIIGAALAVATGALSTVTGSIKAALARAAIAAGEEVLKQLIKSGVRAAGKELSLQLSREALTKVAKKTFTDTQALLLNRLKESPTTTLIEYAKTELKLDQHEIKLLMKKFKQTLKMKELAKGDKFKKALTKVMKDNAIEQVGLPSKPRIVDMIRHARERAAKEMREEERDGKRYHKYFTRQIQVKLKEINEKLNEKVNGISQAENEFKTKIKLKRLKVGRGFKLKNDYDPDVLDALDDVLDGLNDDIDEYITGNNESLVLTEVSSKTWRVQSNKAVQAYIDNVYYNVQTILSTGKGNAN